MKKQFFRTALISAAAVCVLLVSVSVASGANLTESDPLVTLSYLTETFRTALLDDVRKIADEASAKLGEAADSRAEKLTFPAEMPAASATHEQRNLAAGEAFSAPAGSELMLLSGAATVDAAGLFDATDGTALPAGGTLTVNHLYTVTQPLTVTAAEAAALLLPKA